MRRGGGSGAQPLSALSRSSRRSLCPRTSVNYCRTSDAAPREGQLGDLSIPRVAASWPHGQQMGLLSAASFTLLHSSSESFPTLSQAHLDTVQAHLSLTPNTYTQCSPLFGPHGAQSRHMQSACSAAQPRLAAAQWAAKTRFPSFLGARHDLMRLQAQALRGRGGGVALTRRAALAPRVAAVPLASAQPVLRVAGHLAARVVGSGALLNLARSARGALSGRAGPIVFAGAWACQRRRRGRVVRVHAARGSLPYTSPPPS